MINLLSNKKIISGVTSAFLILSQPVFSQEVASEPINSSHSIAGLTSELTVNNSIELLNRDKQVSNQRTSAYKGMTRSDVSQARKQKSKQATLSLATEGSNFISGYNHSFSIYSAYSELITDVDYDGYFQTFGVTFDADILSPMEGEQALVYADLYLSKDGGPWILYFSTDNFLITGEDTLDEFQVVTQLESGYVPQYYDVLIDLYEVGYSDVVATYSDNDTNELYALPLESTDYDPAYVEVEYYETHGGGSLWLFWVLCFTLVLRKTLKQHEFCKTKLNFLATQA